MSSNIRRVKAELNSLGYETAEFESPQGTVICFDYLVEAGSYEGTPVKAGVSFQGQEHYPEYPPHWIHLSPHIDDKRGGSVQKYEANGREWMAMSRPPGEMWDQLSTKHMQHYIDHHLRRFWNGI